MYNDMWRIKCESFMYVHMYPIHAGMRVSLYVPIHAGMRISLYVHMYPIHAGLRVSQDGLTQVCHGSL